LNGWTAKSPTGDKVKCDKPDKQVAFEGDCAYAFKDGTAENSQIIQNVDLSAVSLVTGDTFTLGGVVNAKGVVNTGIKVIVSYADPALPKSKIKVKLKTATGGYQPLAGELPLTGTSSAIKVQVWNKGTSGKVYYDALSLQPTTGLLPLPLP
jgi:hypothetical protein